MTAKKPTKGKPPVTPRPPSRKLPSRSMMKSPGPRGATDEKASVYGRRGRATESGQTGGGGIGNYYGPGRSKRSDQSR